MSEQRIQTQTILNSVGAAAATNATSQIHAANDGDIRRVRVKRSGHPVPSHST